MVTGPWREPGEENPALGCLLIFIGLLAFWALVAWLIYKAIKGVT
jgi:hypothetical protein